MVLSNYTKEFKYNWQLAAPVMLGMLGHTFVSFIDNIMVGQLGTAELAAVSLGNSFMFIAMSLGIGFSTAITPLVAEADSANNFTEGKSAFKHGLFLCTVLGILMFLLVLFSKPLLYLMKQPVEVVELAIPYLDLVAFSLIPLIIFQAIKQFSDGLSMTKYPMYATILANVINVALNYVLIFGKFGFPQLGIVGALSGLLGKNPQAANQIALNLSSMTFMVAMGLSVASMIRVGNQKGLHQYFELRRIAFSLFLLGTIFAVAFGLIFFLFHDYLPRIYVDFSS